MGWGGSLPLAGARRPLKGLGLGPLKGAATTLDAEVAPNSEQVGHLRSPCRRSWRHCRCLERCICEKVAALRGCERRWLERRWLGRRWLGRRRSYEVSEAIAARGTCRSTGAKVGEAATLESAPSLRSGSRRRLCGVAHV